MPLVSKTFSQIITFTRASSATFFNSAGVLQTATTDAPRLDYNPSTLAAQGLLIEESRTNSIRNNTMQGAVAGTPGTAPTNWTITTPTDGVNADVVGTGTQNGITYIDVRYSGTSSTGSFATRLLFDTTTQIVAANGQNWTGSAWVALVGGSLTNVAQLTLQLRYNTVAGTQVTQQSVSLTSATATMSRFSNTFTAADPTIERVSLGLGIDFTNSAAVDFTLRIGLPQLEQGAFATSVIPTTTAAVTRAADVASVNTLSPWFNATAGTLYAEFNVPALTTSTTSCPSSFNDGTASERFFVRLGGGANAQYVVTDGGVAQAVLDVGAYSTGTISKIAVAYAVNDFAAVQNAGTVQTDTSGTLPTVTLLNLGTQTGGTASWLNGYLRRITYYPRRLSNSELQAITA